MLHALPTLILWIAVGVAVLFFLAGSVAAMLAAGRTARRLSELRAHSALIDAPALAARVERLNATLTHMPALLERAHAAIDRINTALRELRLPQAVAALRAAGAAIRLLLLFR